VSIETYRVDLDSECKSIERPRILPAKFHLQSEMTRTVEPGEQVFNFDLTKDQSLASVPAEKTLVSPEGSKTAVV